MTAAKSKEFHHGEFSQLPSHYRTDRILFSCDFGIVKQLFYNRREYKESDHRPIVSYFVVETKRIDRNRKEDVMKQVYEVEFPFF